MSSSLNFFGVQKTPAMDTRDAYIGKFAVDTTNTNTSNVFIDDFRLFNSALDAQKSQLVYYGQTLISGLAPTNLRIVDISSTTVRIQYTANPAAASYEIRTVPETSTLTTTDISCVITGLSQYTPYTIYVFGVQADGKKGTSAKVAVLEPPENLIINPSNTNTSVGLQYTAPFSASTYRIQTTPATSTVTTSSLSTTLSGFTNSDISYTVIVYARDNAQGISSPVLRTIGNKPDYVVISDITNTTLSIIYPAMPGASYYDMYTVPATNTTRSPTTSADISGLSAGTYYTVYIRSVDANGTPSFNASISITMPRDNLYYYKFDANDNAINATPVSGINTNTYSLSGDIYDVSASSFSSSNSANPYNAFDASAGSSWISSSNIYDVSGDYTGSISTSVQRVGTISGEWLQIKLPYSLKMTQYTISSRPAFANEMPRVFYILGSNDGITWIPIDFQVLAGSVITNAGNPATDAPPVGTTFTKTNISDTGYYANTYSASYYTYFRIVVRNIYISQRSTGISEWNIRGEITTLSNYANNGVISTQKDSTLLYIGNAAPQMQSLDYKRGTGSIEFVSQNKNSISLSDATFSTKEFSAATWIKPTTVATNLGSTSYFPTTTLGQAFGTASNVNQLTIKNGILHADWELRTPSPSGRNWSSICWSKELGLFVAVANNGDTAGNRVMTSSDGISWSAQTTPADNSWNSVCWSPDLELFAAVSNTIMTSPNATTWTTRTSPNLSWSSICWSPELSLFAAVAASGTGDRIMTSPDGLTWTGRVAPSTRSWTSICWSSERRIFVAVSGSNADTSCIMTSHNGIYWVSRTAPSINNWTSVCWSAQRALFIAIASSGTGNRVMTSPDGFTWTARVSPADNNWTSVCWSKESGLFTAVASSGSGPGVGKQIMTSADGINWFLRVSPVDNSWNSVVWSPQLEMFCAVGTNGSAQRIMTNAAKQAKIVRNTTGTNIASQTNYLLAMNDGAKTKMAQIEVNLSGGIVYAYEKEAKTSNSVVAMTSSAINTAYASGTLATTGQDGYGILGVNYYVSKGQFATPTAQTDASFLETTSLGRALGTTTDARLLNMQRSVLVGDWVNRTAATAGWRGIAWSPELGIFAGVGETTTTISSTDGITWSAKTSSTLNQNWYSICWSPQLGIFAAVSLNGTGNQAMTSSNGIDWTTQSTNASTSSQWSGICWSAELGIFVAVSLNNTRVMTSPNGINWSETTSVGSNTYESVAWSPELRLFVAVGNGRYMTSTNGTNWTETSIAGSWLNVVWSSELRLFVAIGVNAIMTSTDGIGWTSRTSPANVNWRGIVWAAEIGLFMSVSQNNNSNVNTAMASHDGINWRLVPIQSTVEWFRIAWSPSLQMFAALAYSEQSGGTTRAASLAAKQATIVPYTATAQTSSIVDYLLAIQDATSTKFALLEITLSSGVLYAYHKESKFVNSTITMNSATINSTYATATATATVSTYDIINLAYTFSETRMPLLEMAGPAVDSSQYSTLGLASSSSKYWGAVSVPLYNRVYFIPSLANTVLAMDSSTNTLAATIPVSSGSFKWSSGILAPNGKIYCVPTDASSVLIIDPSTNTADSTTIAGITGSNKFIGGALAPNGKIYCPPLTANYVLVIDTINNTTSQISVGQNGWSGAVLANNGKIYGVPYSSAATSVIIIDPSTNTADTTTLPLTNTRANMYGGGALSNNGKIYCVPYDASNVLIIDPSANTTNRTTMILADGTLGKYRNVVAAPNGRLYGIPYNATNILVIDPSSNTFDTTALTTGLSGVNKFGDAAVAANGRIYAAPYDASTVHIVTPYVKSVCIDISNGFPRFSRYTHSSATTNTTVQYTSPVSITENVWNGVDAWVHLGVSADASGTWTMYMNGLPYSTGINDIFMETGINNRLVYRQGNSSLGRYLADLSGQNTLSAYLDDFRMYPYATDFSFVSMLYSGAGYTTSSVSPSTLNILDVSTNAIRVSYTAVPKAASYTLRTNPETTTTNTTSTDTWITGVSPSPLTTRYIVYGYGANSGGYLSYPATIRSLLPPMSLSLFSSDTTSVVIYFTYATDASNYLITTTPTATSLVATSGTVQVPQPEFLATTNIGMNADTYSYTDSVDTYKSGTYIASASSFDPTSGGYNPYYAFDNNATTSNSFLMWHTGYTGVTGYTQFPYTSTGDYQGGGTGKFWTTPVVGYSSISGEWLQIQMPYQLQLTGYTLRSRLSHTTAYPYNFFIVGSNDGTTWYPVDIQVSAAYTSNVYTRTGVPASSVYNYFRIITQKTLNRTVLNISSWEIRGVRILTFPSYNLTGLNYETIYNVAMRSVGSGTGTNYSGSANLAVSTYSGILRYYKFDAGDVSTNNVSVANYNTGVITAYDASLVSGVAVLPTINTSVFKRGTGSLQLVKTNQQYVSLPSFTTGTNGFSVAMWFRAGTDASNACIVEYATQPTINTNSVLFQSKSATGSYTTTSTQVVSFECWFRLTTYSGFGTILCTTYVQSIARQTSIQFWTQGGGTVSVSASISLNTWYHLAFVYKDNITNGTLVYLNGVYIGAVTCQSGTQPYSSTSSNVFISAVGSNDIEPNSGVYIDQVRIWNYERTASQIWDGYNGRYLSTTGLICYLPMNEGTGTTLTNLASGQSNFTMTGGTWNSTIPYSINVSNIITMQLNSGNPTLYAGTSTYTASVSVNDNSWNHLAWSISSSGIWNLYINGLQYNTGITQAITSSTYTANYIGRYATDSTLANTTNMYVDDFRDFNRSIDLSYVQFLYNG